MNREMTALTILLLAVVLIGVGLWAWRKRTRRDAGITAPWGEAPAGAETLATFAGFYVATTRHDEPLERLAIRGLGFRSRVEITVTDAGVALDLTGQPRVFLASERIDTADQATVAIDRVVERDGLVRVVWRTDGGERVDSYLRSGDSSARSLTEAIGRILTTSAPSNGIPA